jgi:hypothetical protein
MEARLDSPGKQASGAYPYLAACVFHGVSFGRTPEGAPYGPEGVSAEEAAFPQRTDWSRFWKEAGPQQAVVAEG